MKKNGKLIGILAAVLVLLFNNCLWAAPNATTLQGVLKDSGNQNIAGPVDLRIRIYDGSDPFTATGLYSEEHLGVILVGGVYNITLGTGTNTVGQYDEFLFIPDSRWLEIAVRLNNLEPWEALSPLQQITAVPYAMQAQEAVSVVTNAINSSMIQDNSITSDDIVDGAGSLLDADTLDALDSTDFAVAGHGHDAIYYTKTQVDSLLATRDAAIAALQATVATLEEKLQYVNVSGNDMYVVGANLHIVDGSGTTDGDVNGLGNLIVGYNELRGFEDDRSGSHNLIVGLYQNYSSYGGLVAGFYNSISGITSTITGGRNNTASGIYTSVSGGSANRAIGSVSSVSGGYKNTAAEEHSSVSGGAQNVANGYASSVSVGNYNTASGGYASVSGGSYNTASGYSSSVSGGRYNMASGNWSSIVGGGSDNYNPALGNRTVADYSSILGGRANITGDPLGVDHSLGVYSTISGGEDNTASGYYSSVSGGDNNTASGHDSSVSGGTSNTADGVNSSVSGGSFNTAGGDGTSISGGAVNRTSHLYSSVSGGTDNMASGYCSSVSGGQNNTASGEYSSVSGGGSDEPAYGNRAVADYSSILGGIFNITGDPLGVDHSLGVRSTISGGDTNRTTGISSTVSGGVGNSAEALRTAIGGGNALSATGTNEYRDPDTP